MAIECHRHEVSWQSWHGHQTLQRIWEFDASSLSSTSPKAACCNHFPRPAWEWKSRKRRWICQKRRPLVVSSVQHLLQFSQIYDDLRSYELLRFGCFGGLVSWQNVQAGRFNLGKISQACGYIRGAFKAVAILEVPCSTTFSSTHEGVCMCLLGCFMMPYRLNAEIESRSGLFARLITTCACWAHEFYSW